MSKCIKMSTLMISAGVITILASGAFAITCIKETGATGPSPMKQVARGSLSGLSLIGGILLLYAGICHQAEEARGLCSSSAPRPDKSKVTWMPHKKPTGAFSLTPAGINSAWGSPAQVAKQCKEACVYAGDRCDGWTTTTDKHGNVMCHMWGAEAAGGPNWAKKCVTKCESDGLPRQMCAGACAHDPKSAINMF